MDPGNALSKLLDLAMANAAKELSPELDRSSSGTAEASPRRESFLDYVPEKKSESSRVYSIAYLLSLRKAPEVASFDIKRLPEQSFWVQKPQQRPPKNQNREPRHNGPSRKNRHNSTSGGSANAPSWERRPAGFLKSPELDSMSQEKILQLLGETGDEGTPEWDSQDISQTGSIDMGLTVEDFERWKQHMRQEERRKHGEPYEEEVADQPRANEVDSFFSFVRPQHSDSTASPVTSSNRKTSESKSSRFSSFFSGNDDQRPPMPAPTGSTGSVNSTGEHSLRFFGLAESRSRQTSQLGLGLALQNLGQQKLPQQSKMAPPNLPPPNLGQQNLQQKIPEVMPQQGQPQFQNLRPGQMPPSGPHPGQPRPGQMMPPQMMGPGPGMRSGPMMQGPPGLGMPANDSFFMSLMNKREIPLDDSPNSPQQGKQQSPGQLNRTEPNFGQPGMPGFYPYGPPPGMFPGGMPPGMPGMPRQPGQPGQPGQPPQQGQAQPGQNQDLSRQGQTGQNGPHQPGQQDQSGQRGAPGKANTGQFPPQGYYMYPPGMGNMGAPQGMPPHMLQAQQAQQQAPPAPPQK